jgi:hypothetical protein
LLGGEIATVLRLQRRIRKSPNHHLGGKPPYCFGINAQ